MRLAESSIEDLYRRLLDLALKVTANAQGLRSATQALPPPAQGGGGGGAFFVMAPASGTIQGTWSGGAPTAAGSFSGTVYPFSGGTFGAGVTATVYNGLPAPLANSLACVCIPDNAGNYIVIGQSCS